MVINREYNAGLCIPSIRARRLGLARWNPPGSHRYQHRTISGRTISSRSISPAIQSDTSCVAIFTLSMETSHGELDPGYLLPLLPELFTSLTLTG